MNLTQGIVRALDGGEALVEVVNSGCGRCHDEGGCGGKADLTCRGPRRYRVDNQFGARVGDTVTIAVDDGVLRRLATRAYTVPLLTTVLGALSASALVGSGQGEAPAIVGALVGLAGGWWFMARGRLGGAAAKPKILSRN